MDRYTCEVCGAIFDANRSHARYCSARCRNKGRKLELELLHERQAHLLHQFTMLTPDGDPDLYRALVRESRRLLAELRR